MRKLPASALDKSASAVRRGVESRTLSRHARGQAGLETHPLRKFIATGAGDPEVAAWMSAHAQAQAELLPLVSSLLAKASAALARI